MMNRIRPYIPTVLFMLVILALSVKRVPAELYPFWNIDKLYHVIFYALLGLLWARTLARTRKVERRTFIGPVLLITFVYGASMEVVQYFLPERSASVPDAMADGLGGFIGAVVYERFLWIRRRVY